MSQNVGNPETGRVARRQVLYVPGYDPFPARRYRELYRTEAAAQAYLSGDRLAINALPPHTLSYRWGIEAEIEGQRVDTRFDVLIWSDIVKRSMSTSIAGTYGQLLRTAWIYFATGAIFRLVRMRKGPVIAAFYPVIVLLGQLAVALAAASLLGHALSALGPPALAWAGLLVVPPILMWFRRQDGRILAYYLMHHFAFSAGHRGREAPDLDERVGAFADLIASALAEPLDEVLVVGHSSGVHLAILAVARLLDEGRVPEEGPAFSLLSLGQTVPMVSFLPEADRLRDALTTASRSSRLTWIDVSAPGDGCAFALCDPVAVSGAARSGKRWPLVISAAFTRTLRPETWQRLRRRFYRLHFQYLCAFDALPGRSDDYDYFRITAGPKTLAARLGGRKPSPARIEHDVAGYSGAVQAGAAHAAE